MLLHSHVDNYVRTQQGTKDIYSLGNTMQLLVHTDRLQVGDWQLLEGMADKGKLVNRLTIHWAMNLDIYFNLISNSNEQMPKEFNEPHLADRTVLVEKVEPLLGKVIVSGYLLANDYQDYLNEAYSLPKNLKNNAHLVKPLFFNDYQEIRPEYLAEIEDRSIELYKEAADYAWHRGLILAQTTFHWGVLPHANNELILFGDLFTPENSIYYALEDYGLNKDLPHYDMNYITDYLVNNSGWDMQTTPPLIPDNILANSYSRFNEVFERITGKRMIDESDITEFSATGYYDAE